MARIVLDLPDALQEKVAELAQQTARAPEAVLTEWLSANFSALRDVSLKNAFQRPATGKPASWQKYLVMDADGIGIKGRRILLEHVLERYLFARESVAEIAQEFGLSLEQVQAAVDYYEQNSVEVLAYLAEFFAWRRNFEQELESRQPKGLREKLMARLRTAE
ncbi:MAG: DUF433 domain-containing protein [Planctomycetota bacterium]